MGDIAKYKTRQQRLKVYRQALKEIQMQLDLPERRELGLCKMLANAGVWVYPTVEIDGVRNNFADKLPELYAQRPKSIYRKDDRYWWKPGKWGKRIDALEAAIKMIEG
jgi:hypothetical protein